MSKRPLEGLKVLDFTHVVAGPFATRVLGDLGADVIKINCEARALTSNAPEHPFYIMWNRNKRALSLNMSTEEGRRLGKRLALQADVVIDNFSVGVLDRWGVGYQDTQPDNPGVIYVQMSGMGDSGPWSDFVTYAPTIHAISGLTSLTGVPGREDVGIGYSYNDHQAGLHGAFAVLAALERRRRTGRGQRIDISQFEVGVNFSGPSLMDLFVNGRGAKATGNKLPYDEAAPHNVYRCASRQGEGLVHERWIAIACMQEAHWQALKRVMGNPAWAEDPAFSSMTDRCAHADALDAHLSTWTADRDDYELMAGLQAAGVPAGVVQNGADLVEQDPELGRRDFCHKIEDVHPNIGQTWCDRLPLHFEKTPCDEYQRVRVLGEDNEAVLRDWLSLSDDEISAIDQETLR